MRSRRNLDFSPVKDCAKWLILSLAFVWLVGCAAMPGKKVAKRDPFQDKFSCGEQTPRGKAAAAARPTNTDPNAVASKGGTPSQGNPGVIAQRLPSQGMPGMPVGAMPGQGMTTQGDPRFANPAYANGAPASAGFARPPSKSDGYANPGYYDPYANSAQANAVAKTTVKKAPQAQKAQTVTRTATASYEELDTGSADREFNVTGRTIEASAEFGMSPADALPQENSTATPVSFETYEAPVSEETPGEMPAQRSWEE